MKEYILTKNSKRIAKVYNQGEDSSYIEFYYKGSWRRLYFYIPADDGSNQNIIVALCNMHINDWIRKRNFKIRVKRIKKELESSGSFFDAQKCSSSGC